MSTQQQHAVRGAVIARPGNWDGSDQVYDAVAGIAVVDGYVVPVTQPVALAVGDRFAVVTWPPVPAGHNPEGSGPSADAATRLVGIYEMAEEGVPDMLTDQPAPGDTITFTAPASTLPFLAGAVMTVGEDRTLAQAGTAIVLGLFPLLAGELYAGQQALTDRVQQLEDTLRQLLASVAASPLLGGMVLPPSDTDLPIGTPAGEPTAGVLPDPVQADAPTVTTTTGDGEVEGVDVPDDQPETIEDHQPVDTVDVPDPGPATVSTPDAPDEADVPDQPPAPVPDPAPEDGGGDPGIPGQG